MMACLQNEMMITQMPCALRNRLRNGGRHTAFAALSTSDCQSAFQNWVAFDRNASSDIFDKEHLLCPLLWCRKNFDDLGSCLQHLSTCPWLSNAWYWCPYCHRPESFSMQRTESKDNVQHRLRRKLSKLRRAVSFFRRFGHKGSSLEIDSPPPYERECWNKCELDGLSESLLQTSPTYGTQSIAFHNSSMMNDKSNLINAEPDVSSCSFDINELYGSTPLIDLIGNFGAPIAELQDCHQPIKDRYLDVTTDKEVCVYPCIDKYVNGFEAQAVVSPISQVDMRYPFCASDWPSLVNPISPIEWYNQDVRTFHDAAKGVPSISLPGTHGDDGSLLSARTLVGEVSELVQALNSDWMQRLKPLMDHSMINVMAETWSPFETGLKALQQCYRGVFPSTFEDAFSLMHIALASVYTFHHDDAFYPWDSFFDEILRWHQVIVKDSERCLFLKVANVLWLALKHSEPVSQDPGNINGFITSYQGSHSWLLQQNRPKTIDESEGLVSLRTGHAVGSSPHDLNLCCSSLAGQCGVDPNLLDELKNGKIMKMCSRYLDYIEHAVICERIGVREPCSSLLSERSLSNIEIIDAVLIRPLLKIDGLDSFRDHIFDTQSYLRDGLLHNIREVEVKLIVNNSVSMICDVCVDSFAEFYQSIRFPIEPSSRTHTPPTRQIMDFAYSVSDDYLKTVSSICDDAAIDPNWRDGYYAMDLDKVLAIYSELGNEEPQINHSLDGAKDFDPSFPVGDQQLPFYITQTVDPSNSSLGLADSSPSYDGSFSFSDTIPSASSDTSYSFSSYLPSTSSDISYVNSDLESSAVEKSSSPLDTWPSVNDSNLAGGINNFSSFVTPKPVDPSDPSWATTTMTKSSKLKLVIPSSRPNLQSSNSTPSPLRCSVCNTPFTGHFRDQETNLKRHMRNVHGKRLPLVCTAPQCNKKYQRSDNLRKHRSAVHGLIDPPVRKRKRKQE